MEIEVQAALYLFLAIIATSSQTPRLEGTQTKINIGGCCMAKSKKGFKGLKWSIAVAIVFSLVLASGCSSSSEDSGSNSNKTNMAAAKSSTNNSAVMDKAESTSESAPAADEAAGSADSGTTAEPVQQAGAGFGANVSDTDSSLASEDGITAR